MRPLKQTEITGEKLIVSDLHKDLGDTFNVEVRQIDFAGLKDEVKKKMEDARKKIQNDFDEWKIAQLLFEGSSVIRIFLENEK